MAVYQEIKNTATECIKLDRLLKSIIREFIKDSNSDKIKNSVSILIAIERNIMAIIILLSCNYKKQNIGKSFKMPIGLLLRSCCINIITLAYLVTLDDDIFQQVINNLDAKYAFSMLERKEVYVDQVKSVGIDLDNFVIEHLYELNLEDRYIENLSIAYDNDAKDLKVKIPNKAEKAERGIREPASFTNMYKEVKAKWPIAETVYSYYKYFSQYEHFSSLGFGDAFAELDSDNIYLPGAPAAIETLLADIKQCF